MICGASGGATQPLQSTAVEKPKPAPEKTAAFPRDRWAWYSTYSKAGQRLQFVPERWLALLPSETLSYSPTNTSHPVSTGPEARARYPPFGLSAKSEPRSGAHASAENGIQ
jgi:hypothetical protein